MPGGALGNGADWQQELRRRAVGCGDCIVLRAMVAPDTARAAELLGRTNGHGDWESPWAAPKRDWQPEPRQRAVGGVYCIVPRATVSPGTGPGGGAARAD